MRNLIGGLCFLVKSYLTKSFFNKDKARSTQKQLFVYAVEKINKKLIIVNWIL